MEMTMDRLKAKFKIGDEVEMRKLGKGKVMEIKPKPAGMFYMVKFPKPEPWVLVGEGFLS